MLEERDDGTTCTIIIIFWKGVESGEEENASGKLTWNRKGRDLLDRGRLQDGCNSSHSSYPLITAERKRK